MEFIEKYRGITQFGKEYKIMLENDSHAPGSVDTELAKNMIRLCNETNGYLYKKYTPTAIEYTRGSRSKLEIIVSSTIRQYENDEEKILAIAEYCSGLKYKVADINLNNMVLGGTEEEIIDRGSDWCTDIARVSCVMYQIAGFPSRIVNTFNVNQAYSGHVINEVCRNDVWGVIDTTNGIAYYKNDKKPATSWEVMNSINGMIGLKSNNRRVKVDYDQFKGVAIANYFVSDHDLYNYNVSQINEYYRKILEASSNGWQEGLRWICNEDIK